MGIVELLYAVKMFARYAVVQSLRGNQMKKRRISKMSKEKTKGKTQKPTQETTPTDQIPLSTSSTYSTSDNENELRFSCDICGAKFVTEAGLNRHIARKHGNQVSAEKKEEEYEDLVKSAVPEVKLAIGLGSKIMFERLKWKELSDTELDGLSTATARVLVKYSDLFGKYSAELGLAFWVIIIGGQRIIESRETKNRESGQEHSDTRETRDGQIDSTKGASARTDKSNIV